MRANDPDDGAADLKGDHVVRVLGVPGEPAREADRIHEDHLGIARCREMQGDAGRYS